MIRSGYFSVKLQSHIGRVFQRPSSNIRLSVSLTSLCLSLIMSMNVRPSMVGYGRGRNQRGRYNMKTTAKEPILISRAGRLQKGGVPATPSGTATLLRLSPSHQFCLRPLLTVTDFRHPRLPWLDGRCVQGPGTYSPRHG